VHLFSTSLALCSFVVWFVRSVLSVDRVRFVRGHLLRRVDQTTCAPDRTPAAAPGTEDSDALVQFVGDYLRVDGVFLLRLIAHNTNGVAAADITLALWNDWYERRLGRDAEASGAMLTVPRRRPSVQ